jgi:hypothetical protein
LLPFGRARVLHVPGAEANADVGDRNYLVLAKPNVIMNDIRLRGLALAGDDAAGRKNKHNHAQTARNLKRSLRNSAAGARLVQPEGLDSRFADLNRRAASRIHIAVSLIGLVAASCARSDAKSRTNAAP